MTLHEYQIPLSTIKSLKPANAVIVAVAHLQFHHISLADWQKLLLPGGVISDVKGIVSQDSLRKSGYHLWRL